LSDFPGTSVDVALTGSDECRDAQELAVDTDAVELPSKAGRRPRAPREGSNRPDE